MSESIKNTDSDEASEECADELNRIRPPIEIGLIVAGRFSLSERRLLQDVESRFKHLLELRLPEFDWRIVISRRRDIGERGREESTELLRLATEERDLYRWDFAIVLINEELLAHYRSFALAVLSRPLDAAVISTARLIPDAEGPGLDDGHTDESDVVDRITIVMLRSIAHLGGLRANKDPDSLLYRPESPDDLSLMQVLTPAELHELRDNLSEVADLRLEESSKARQSAWRFLLRATLINQWTSAAKESAHAITAVSYLKMATFCASVGLLIGALGASFEEQTHFQHVIFVDDEL